MNYRKLIYRFVLMGAVVLVSLLHVSCDRFREDLPECRLRVRFKYDYHMLSVDAFHEKVEKVTLYVFDQEGKFMFMRSEEGDALATGYYSMELELPVGRYKMMAWATARDDNSYDITAHVPGRTSIEDMELRLLRDDSPVIDREIDDLWYGEILDVHFTGTADQMETINLIKNTNKVRFVFMGNNNMPIDLDDYTCEIVENNGYLAYDNSLLADETLSYRPYYTEQRNESTAVVEMNTMRLMARGDARFTVTKKSALRAAQPVLDINLIDYLVLTRLQEHAHWDEQEYLDREDAYRILFVLSGTSTEERWVAMKIYVNDYLCYSQEEEMLE